MHNLGEILKKINIKTKIRFDEPMSRHTSFRIGGPADLFLQPQDLAELPALFALLNREGIPTFILGAGANILVADRGIRGAVLDLSAIRGCRLEDGGVEAEGRRAAAANPSGARRAEGDSCGLEAGGRRAAAAKEGDSCGLLSSLAGTPASELSEEALRHSLSGAEFLYSMPGSVGGSVWMNARCYSASVSDVLERVQILDEQGTLKELDPDPAQFGYKRSPFQGRKALILRAFFRLRAGNRAEIEQTMLSHRQDRESKGHFLYPCAGSIFKNNRDFGEPTGKIIESLGLKGLRIGNAMVSERHANIIVNTGQARAEEVLELMLQIEARVKWRYGFRLEREVLLVGDWPSDRA